MKIYLATGNENKKREMAQILSQHEIVTPKDEGIDFNPIEDGTTFYENSIKKAKALYEIVQKPVIADDSGICVDALNGIPGIYSARYAGGHGDDKANRDLLLKNLDGANDRSAKFVSSIVLVKADGRIVKGLGETHGKIGFKEEGTNGFGYDCIFISDDLGVSFGLASDEQKNRVSHRYRGLIDLLNNLR